MKALIKQHMESATATDLYNALNSSAVLAVSDTFATWGHPQRILPARLASAADVLGL